MQGSLIEKGERVLSLQWVSPEFGAGCRSCRDQYLSCNKELSQQKKPLVAARTSIKGLHHHSLQAERLKQHSFTPWDERLPYREARSPGTITYSAFTASTQTVAAWAWGLGACGLLSGGSAAAAQVPCRFPPVSALDEAVWQVAG